MILALANQKGGVGKTTTAVNLGAYLARGRWRVLLVDLDPQGNATSGLGVHRDYVRLSTYDCLLRGASVKQAALPTELDGLDLLPSSVDLAGAEVELVDAPSRETRVRDALEPVKGSYDWILVDCPPSLGLLTVNALAAADGVLVPIQCEFYALEGLAQLVRTVELVKRTLNPRLHVAAVVLTMYDPRTNLSEQVAGEVRRYFGSCVARTVIPRSVRLAEAPSHGKPVMLYDPHSKGARAYEALAEELGTKLRPVAGVAGGVR
ncbi:MAG: ParA family protein [Armatimonadota bacterium]|nr:ParA family protein [Armatimonadota bacterium]MDR7514515.1 ParA family protein [Armatimonadota bacterium]MDR7541703.1 ParA family protein [Armatimonadota bacterium]MDR7565213.1 ParA family protein [Armatimonadota bacterium]MDR7577311.1 ParA family protein [Armatimonadota bacterium]